MLRIDHVIYGVRDLDAAAQRFYDQYGLASVPGGRHEEWGTANVVIPLGDHYIELLGVVDPQASSQSTLGKWLEVGVMSGDRLMGWALATDNLDKVASRLGLTVTQGSRTRPDGTTITWRSAGLEKIFADQSLPFFITWDSPESHPGRAAVEHRAAPTGIAWIEVVAPKVKLMDWTGKEDLPLRVEEHGTPGLRAVGISTADGEVVLR